MKRVIVSLAVFLVLFAAILPGPAVAGCCWWPGAVVGGIVYGAVAIATLPLWALSAAFVPPPGPYPPPAYYGAPHPCIPRPGTRRPRLRAAAYTYAPSPVPDVQREMVFPNGRYLLFGDGVTQPWQWAWEPAGASSPQSAATAAATR